MVKSKFSVRNQHRQRMKSKDYTQKKHSPKQNNEISAMKTAGIKPKIPLKQTYQEIKERITPEILSDMLQMIRVSDNLGVFYQHWTTKYDDRFLVVLGLIDEKTRENLAYLDKKRLIDLSTSTGENETFNHQYYQTLKAEAQQALSEMPLESLSTHDSSIFLKFPDVYLLSSKKFYQRLLEWSLPFEIHLIATKQDINNFMEDKKDKIIMFDKNLSNALLIDNRNQEMKNLNAYLNNHSIKKIFLYREEKDKSNNKVKSNLYYLKQVNREKLITAIRKLKKG